MINYRTILILHTTLIFQTCLKHTISFLFNLGNKEEIDHLAEENIIRIVSQSFIKQGKTIVIYGSIFKNRSNKCYE